MGRRPSPLPPGLQQLNSRMRALVVGPLLPLPVGRAAFAATALGVLVCGAAFAGVTVTAHPDDVTSDETRS